MEKIGLIFGSFNPIHKGHIAIAEKCISEKLVDRVAFVPAKQNPFKIKYEIGFFDRVEMIHEVINQSLYKDKLFVSYAEIRTPSNYTFDAIQKIKGNKDKEYIIICGADSYFEIENWYNGKQILDENKFIVFDREHFSFNVENIIFNFALEETMNISSTKVRQCVKENNKDLSKLIFNSTEKIIKNRNYYKN